VWAVHGAGPARCAAMRHGWGLPRWASCWQGRSQTGAARLLLAPPPGLTCEHAERRDEQQKALRAPGHRPRPRKPPHAVGQCGDPCERRAGQQDERPQVQPVVEDGPVDGEVGQRGQRHHGQRHERGVRAGLGVWGGAWRRGVEWLGAWGAGLKWGHGRGDEGAPREWGRGRGAREWGPLSRPHTGAPEMQTVYAEPPSAHD
jgi:hypothetical protein